MRLESNTVRPNGVGLLDEERQYLLDPRTDNTQAGSPVAEVVP
jgi:hypothetical protein